MIKQVAILLTVLWSSLMAVAQEDAVVNQNPLELIGARASDKVISHGTISEVLIDWTLAPEHHAYLDQFKLKAKNHDRIQILEFTVSPVVDFTDVLTGKIKEGTKGPGQMRASIKVPKGFYKGEYMWDLELTYQACTSEYCLFPKKIPVSAKLVIDGPERRFNFSALFGGEGAAELFGKARELGWFFTFFIVFLAGIVTSFTPCIFPMIPITLAVLGTRKKGQTRFHGFTLSLTYVMGIALTYSLLGVIAASTGALFGALLGHPVVVGAIALVFIAMALSMFGLYDIEAPAWVTDRIGNLHGKGEYLNAFVAGLVAGVVASPCVGPVLAGVLLYVATTKDVVLGFFLLFTFAIGLGLIFLVLGTFTHLIHKLPRTGRWTEFVKKSFGVVMLLMATYFVYPVMKSYVTPNLPSLQDNSGPTDGLVPGSFAKPDWKEYSDELLEKARLESRPVIIDFKAEWCIACKELEAFTFSDPQVLETGKEFLWLYFDATNSSDELLKLRQRYSIVGLPLVIIYDKEGQWRKDLTLTGFEKAEDFLKRIKKAL